MWVSAKTTGKILDNRTVYQNLSSREYISVSKVNVNGHESCLLADLEMLRFVPSGCGSKWPIVCQKWTREKAKGGSQSENATVLENQVIEME